ncbi:cytochrome P450 [Crucibulum laeve]|uniref:Cytochrome P450 n=1 Tax=Crucibulum laeve TaxID=68775 RepID=A0A5C3M248_9AGAR|nr:cytochrome P450 [Crucibulum laeve]
MLDISLLHLCIALGGLCLLYLFSRWTTQQSGLRGPPSPSIFWGVSKMLHQALDPGHLYEAWAKEYGLVYQITAALGTPQVIVCDSKAIAYIFSKDAFTFVRTPGFRAVVEVLIGKGILWAEGESHKRQRKGLNPAFSNSAVQALTGTFFDVAHKIKASWDVILDSHPTDSEVIIEVQEWMNRAAIDCIGIAGFSHDFNAVGGESSAAIDALKSFNEAQFSGLSLLSHLLQFFIPPLGRLPSRRNLLYRNLSQFSERILGDLLATTRRERDEILEEKEVKTSAIGLLIKAERSEGNLHIDEEEVMAQMKTILIAGFDPPATTLVWVLIELSRRLDIQAQLREELNHFPNADPSWEKLQTSFPLLDAVVSEVLRLHPSPPEMTRMAGEDTVLPLNTPIIDANGRSIDQIPISKGTLITLPTQYLNSLPATWGSDAKEFNPYRWLKGSNKATEENVAHRRLLSFGDGTRICLGKAFTLAEMKAVIMVLIRSYSFELPNGPNTKIERHSSLLPRPKIAGQDGAKVPLRVRRNNNGGSWIRDIYV